MTKTECARLHLRRAQDRAHTFAKVVADIDAGGWSKNLLPRADAADQLQMAELEVELWQDLLTFYDGVKGS